MREPMFGKGNRMKHLVKAVLMAGLIGGAPIATLAQSSDDSVATTQSEKFEAAQESLINAIKRVFELLESTAEQVMVYEVPEVLPNGDIIIRRTDEAPAAE
jgi:hypothetical protein